jgi:hypothetical protein
MLEDILQALHPETYLCIATDITLPTEYIKTKSICLEKENIDLHNRPPFLSSIKCSFCRSVNYFVHLIIKNEKMKIKKEILIFVLGILAFFIV